MKTAYLVTVQSPDVRHSIGLPLGTLAIISDLFRECLWWDARSGTGATESFTARQGGLEVTVSRYSAPAADKGTEP